MKKKDEKVIQPKFEPRKEPSTEHGGEGLEEYTSDAPNFSVSRKELKRRKKNKKS